LAVLEEPWWQRVRAVAGADELQVEVGDRVPVVVLQPEDHHRVGVVEVEAVPEEPLVHLLPFRPHHTRGLLLQFSAHRAVARLARDLNTAEHRLHSGMGPARRGYAAHDPHLVSGVGYPLDEPKRRRRRRVARRPLQLQREILESLDRAIEVAEPLKVFDRLQFPLRGRPLLQSHVRGIEIRRSDADDTIRSFLSSV